MEGKHYYCYYYKEDPTSNSFVQCLDIPTFDPISLESLWERNAWLDTKYETLWSLKHSFAIILEATIAVLISTMKNWQQIKLLNIYCNKYHWSEESMYLRKKYIAYVPANVVANLILLHLLVHDMNCNWDRNVLGYWNKHLF